MIYANYYFIFLFVANYGMEIEEDNQFAIDNMYQHIHLIVQTLQNTFFNTIQRPRDILSGN